MTPRLEALIEKKGTVRLRTIDVGGWESEVAIQYDLRYVPQLWLYNGTELITRNTDEVLAILERP